MNNYITTLVGAISQDVVAGLALLGMPSLTDGAILLGSAMVAQQGAPPRVVFEPTSMRFGDADRSVISNAGRLPVLLERPLATLFLTLRAHVWGIADPTVGAAQIPSADIDATDALVRQVIRSCLRIAPGIGIYSAGTFANSQRGGDALLAVNGWYATFSLEVATPITDYPLAFPSATNVPPGTPIGADIATFIQPADGTPQEAGPTITIP